MPDNSQKPVYQQPWPMPPVHECSFYHTMEYPDGDPIKGFWTIPSFSNYIGGVDVRGKSVLDVGTATGYLAFEAEKNGAREVTAVDIPSTYEWDFIPYASSGFFTDYHAYVEQKNNEHIGLKKSWWYSWHRNKSNARCVYAPNKEMHRWDCKYDIVIAGALVEHISDPVSAIGAWAKVCGETLVISYTPVMDSDDLLMHPITLLTNPSENYTWWELSRGLYKRIFDILGFDVEIVTSEALLNQHLADYTQHYEKPVPHQRPTVIARKRGNASQKPKKGIIETIKSALQN